MKYFKAFANHSEYESYITGSSVAYPNVSVCEDEYEVHITDVGEIVDPDAPIDYSKKPLTFEITSDGVIKWNLWVDDGMTIVSGNPLVIEYSKNGGEWTSITSNTGASAPSISVVSGDTVQFRGDNATYGDFESNGISTFADSTCGFNVYGNIMSLINSTGFTTATTLSSAYTFANLFGYCTGLTDASNLVLPATIAETGCYQSMFDSCTSLTTAPALPATIAETGCYQYMFYGCTSLTTAPELPATILAIDCYNSMFYGCTSLNYIKCLATDISAENCTIMWAYNVASSGTFVKNASMTSWPTIPYNTNGIPTGWTVEDAS